jgi:hypothetical protein
MATIQWSGGASAGLRKATRSTVSPRPAGRLHRPDDAQAGPHGAPGSRRAAALIGLETARLPRQGKWRLVAAYSRSDRLTPASPSIGRATTMSTLARTVPIDSTTASSRTSSQQRLLSAWRRNHADAGAFTIAFGAVRTPVLAGIEQAPALVSRKTKVAHCGCVTLIRVRPAARPLSREKAIVGALGDRQRTRLAHCGGIA